VELGDHLETNHITRPPATQREEEEEESKKVQAQPQEKPGVKVKKKNVQWLSVQSWA